MANEKNLLSFRRFARLMITKLLISFQMTITTMDYFILSIPWDREQLFTFNLVIIDLF